MKNCLNIEDVPCQSGWIVLEVIGLPIRLGNPATLNYGYYRIELFVYLSLIDSELSSFAVTPLRFLLSEGQ